MAHIPGGQGPRRGVEGHSCHHLLTRRAQWSQPGDGPGSPFRDDDELAHPVRLGNKERAQRIVTDLKRDGLLSNARRTAAEDVQGAR